MRGGTIVTEGGRRQTNVVVKDGAIVALTSDVLPAKRTIDATGLLVLPGGIDSHTHLNSVWPFPDERRPVDDFNSGTRGAAAGGITTVIDFVYALDDESLREACDRVVGDAASKSRIDFALHVVVMKYRDNVISEAHRLLDDGFTSFKFYTPDPDFAVNTTSYLRFLSSLRGTGAIAMFHCEDRAILDYCKEELFRSGRTSPRHYPASKPVEAEILSTAQAINLASVAGVPSYIVHLSAAAALDEAVLARARGSTVYIETRPLYLYLTEERFAAEDAIAARYVGTPPLRTTHDQARLWTSLASGEIDVVASDHVGFTNAQKYQVGDTFDSVPKGVANLETLLPMLYSEGVHGGRISIERLVQVIATNPARIFGLYPRKGTIEVGSDGDLCILDPKHSQTLRGSALHSAADLELFEGTVVTGYPAYTVSRGEVIFEAGQVAAAPGRGQFVPGRLSLPPAPAARAEPQQ
ncbi:MAG: dihydropyrimidinase [Fimbriimonadales bacterium]